MERINGEPSFEWSDRAILFSFLKRFYGNEPTTENLISGNTI